MKDMGKQRVVDKTISPLQVLQALQAGTLTIAQAQAMYTGVMPVGDYKGLAAILDLDLLVNQPLILAEKQWAEDILDSRNAVATVSIPIGTVVGAVVVGVAPAGVITVPADEVWYCTAWGVVIPVTVGYTAGDLVFNFRVSSFPKVDGVDKLYASPEHLYPATVFGDVAAGKFVVGAQFGAGDQLGTELRLVGGDKVTPTVTIETADTAGAIATINFVLFGRKAKVLVE